MPASSDVSGNLKQQRFTRLELLGSWATLDSGVSVFYFYTFKILILNKNIFNIKIFIIF